MVRNMKIARLAERMERDRQDREDRKNGHHVPEREPDNPHKSDTCCDAEPKLPEGWKRHYSKTHAIYFYHNAARGESTWKYPKELPPSETATPGQVQLEAPKPEVMQPDKPQAAKPAAKEPEPPEPEKPPTGKEKLRSIMDECCFTISLAVPCSR